MNQGAHFKSNWLAYLLIAPQLLIIFIFFYWPTGEALFWAFTLEQPFGGGNEFVGFDNFRYVFDDSAYWHSVRISFTFAAASTGLAIAIALVLALFADRQLRAHSYYRVALIWPYAIAAPAAAMAFRFVFNPDVGLMSLVNEVFPGFWEPFISGWQAMAMVILCSAWKLVAYNFIFFLAGLQSIPRSIVEAGALDGAGVVRRMRDLQLPLLAPTFFFILVINITDSFTDSFGIVDVMTQGGPARATNLMVYKIFSDGFVGLDYSGAAAQSIILMLLVIALTIVQFRYVERRVHYR